MKNARIDHVEGRIVIEHDGLKVIIGNDHVTVDTDRKIELKGRSLKKLNGVKGASINEVLHKLQE